MQGLLAHDLGNGEGGLLHYGTTGWQCHEISAGHDPDGQPGGETPWVLEFCGFVRASISQPRLHRLSSMGAHGAPTLKPTRVWGTVPVAQCELQTVNVSSGHGCIVFGNR